MRLHMRETPHDLFAVYDEGDHLVRSFPSRTEAMAYIAGHTDGQRVTSLDRAEIVDRIVKLAGDLR